MAVDGVRVEVRIDDRIRYAHVVKSAAFERTDGLVTLTLVEDDAVDGPTGTVIDGAINLGAETVGPVVEAEGVVPGEGTEGVVGGEYSELASDGPPPPSPGAPDGHDEPTEPAVQVLERVHTGDREPVESAKERRARTRKAAAEDAEAPQE